LEKSEFKAALFGFFKICFRSSGVIFSDEDNGVSLARLGGDNPNRRLMLALVRVIVVSFFVVTSNGSAAGSGVTVTPSSESGVVFTSSVGSAVIGSTAGVTVSDGSAVVFGALVPLTFFGFFGHFF